MGSPTLHSVQAVIFDMDGLMLDTERVTRDSFRRTASELGLDVAEDVYVQMIGRTWEQSKRMLLDTFGDGLPVDALRERWRRNTYHDIENFGLPLKPGLLDLLDLLEQRRIPKAVATGSHRSDAVSLLRKVRLNDRFDGMVCGDEVRNGKPDPEIFLRAAERLAAAQCVVFEDSGPGISAAHMAGMIPILVPDLVAPEEDIRTLAYHVCDSLHDVCAFF